MIVLIRKSVHDESIYPNEGRLRSRNVQGGMKWLHKQSFYLSRYRGVGWGAGDKNQKKIGQRNVTDTAIQYRFREGL